MATKRSGGKGPIKSIIWWAVIAMAVLALWRGGGAPTDISKATDWVKQWLPGVEETMTDIGDSIEKAIPNSKEGKPDKNPKDTGSADGKPDKNPKDTGSAEGKPDKNPKKPSPTKTAK